jgi:nanoRNase/pAp phosphatase (c-di-AMP/oligoRNAs hydrolase)
MKTTVASKDIPQTGHDALMGFYYNGNGWTFSLYHAKHRTDLDLSAIAVKYGGGGHRGACGFTTKSLESFSFLA